MSKKLFDRCVSLAKNLAEFDNLHAQRHYSFLCLKNKVVSTGMNNKWRTDPLASRFGHRFNATHSEIAVLKQLDMPWRLLPHFTMINVRLNKNLEVMLAKPCKNCQNMLEWFEVGLVLYSNNNGGFERFI